MRSAVVQSRLRPKLNGVDDHIMRVHVADKLCVLRTNQAVSCRLQSNQTSKGTRPGHNVPRYTVNERVQISVLTLD